MFQYQNHLIQKCLKPYIIFVMIWVTDLNLILFSLKFDKINKNFIYIIHILYIYYTFNLNLSHYHSYNRTYMHINVCNMQYSCYVYEINMTKWSVRRCPWNFKKTFEKNRILKKGLCYPRKPMGLLLTNLIQPFDQLLLTSMYTWAMSFII